MNLEKIKSLFLKSLIGCLIAAAVLAVVTVLIGQFNDVFAKALFTIFLIALHCLVSFGFIVNNEKQDTFESLTFFTNATFIIIILSFITSVFGVWGILSGPFVFKIYAVYLILLFAILHGETLAKTLYKQSNIDNIVYANYVFMLIVVVMLMPVVFASDSLGSLYYRLLAALGIIDATLTLVAVILHKLYVQKHPTLNDNVFNIQQVPGQLNAQIPGQPNAQVPVAKPRRGMNIFVVLLLVYIVLQFIGAIFVAIIGSIHQGN